MVDFSKYQKKEVAPETKTKKIPEKKKVIQVKEKKELNFDIKLTGDKKLSKNDCLDYIISILMKNKEKYTLDYLRSLKYNLDAINLAK